MTVDLDRRIERLKNVALFLALLAAALAVVALFGYAAGLPVLVHGGNPAAGMSVLTAFSILMLAGAVVSIRLDYPRVARGLSIMAASIAAAVIGGRVAFGQDLIGKAVASALFSLPATVSGRTSYVTALAIMLLAFPVAFGVPFRRAGVAWGAALVATGAALLGYAYGANDIQAISMFRDIAFPSAAALFALSLAWFLVEPTDGWTAVIVSSKLGGSETRRQLAFLVVPVVAGYGLAQSMHAGLLEPGAAMTFMVVLVAVPLALLVLRDGRTLQRLDNEREEKALMEANFARDLSLQLEVQAKSLAAAADERTRTEASLAQTQRLETVGQLTGGLAHDFNNLLMAISGNLELLRRSLPHGSDKAAQYADRVKAAIGKASKLTGQLLAFSRSQRLALQSVELKHVIDGAVGLARSSLGPNIDLDVTGALEGLWVYTDPDQLESALLNLAINAREAMPTGGTLTFEVTRQPSERPGPAWVVVRVRDNGIGMPPDVLSRATEPFFTTRSVGKGSGLGLSQVFGLVKQCRGELHIESEPGAGTSVEMKFLATEPIRPPAAADPVASARQSGAGRGLVLLVDDDDAVRGALGEMLRSDGFQVIEANDGPSALAALVAHTPAVAVMDFLMPTMNGAELATAVHQRLPGLPIVFVSGYSDTLSLDGVSDAVVLRKPFTGEALTHTLIDVLTTRARLAPTHATATLALPRR